jgi:metal-responsive CopG/Arc/MetJ family transcriptional regulator
MTNIKTAISLQKSLFDQAEEIAEKMQFPRSRLYSQALENFIRDYQEKQLFNAINKACSEENKSLKINQEFANCNAIIDAWWRENGNSIRGILLDRPE